MKITCTGCGGAGCEVCEGTGQMKVCFYDAVILQQENLTDKVDAVIDKVDTVLDKVELVLDALEPE